MTPRGPESALSAEGKMDLAQGVLDVIGMTDIPVVSKLAELGSAGISLYRGDYVGAGLSLASTLPIIGKLAEATKVGRLAARTSSAFSLITPKISTQMERRGWTKELLHEVVDNPYTIREATNNATGNAATAYFQESGAYVVKDNVTNEVIQISNRLDPNWIPDATIINPYIPR